MLEILYLIPITDLHTFVPKSSPVVRNSEGKIFFSDRVNINTSAIEDLSVYGIVSKSKMEEMIMETIESEYRMGNLKEVTIQDLITRFPSDAKLKESLRPALRDEKIDQILNC